MALPELTLITSGHSSLSSTGYDILDAALAGGVKQIIVREKQMDSARLLAFASMLRKLTTQHQSKLIIHSHADIAKAVEADGVHLTSHDIAEAPAIRRWLDSPHMSISTSCHNAKELQKSAQMGADFALLSPVFATQSHPESTPLGVKTFKSIATKAPIPVIALGGIHAGNRQQLSGFPIATIRAIMDADDAKLAAQALLSV